MEFKDYYKIMGVSPDASADDIKRAYRKLARKYHPDVSKETDAEARFKELGEAYEALKDPEKRQAYDQLRQSGYRGGQEFRPPPGWQSQHGGFSQTFTQGGAEGFSDFFEAIFGGGGFGGGGLGGGFQRRSRTYRTRGEDLHYPLKITLEEAYHGGSRALQLRMPEVNEQGQMVEKTKTLNVKIPTGVTNGQKIRLKGQGNPGMGGGPNGDLYLEIEIQPHRLYHLEGRDVILQLPVTPWEAALGATVTVPTLAGPVTLKIPSNSQSGTKLRLKGRGLPGNPPGDQYVVLQIMVPEPTTAEAKKLYQEMAQSMPFNPRARLGV